jgi:hypothetical protein
VPPAFEIANCDLKEVVANLSSVSDSVKTARNLAIIVLIASAVYFLPGGGRAANTFEALLWVAFGVGIGYLGLRSYREHRVALHSLGDRYRGLLYGGLAGGVFVYAARTRMWETGLGELAWFAFAALVVYALLEVYRHWRAY